MAQFLIANYKYTTRLASAYDSRADALMLQWADAQEARRFMSVDDLGFERLGSPTSDAIEIAKQIVGNRGS